MRFKVGDKVRVREDLDVNRNYGDFSVAREMEEFLGKEARVMHVEYADYKYYKLDIDGERWIWTDEMLEPIADPLMAKVMERNNKPAKPELVNHPDHYQGNKFEVIDIIEDYNLNFHLGSVIKYVLRAGKKDSKSTDLEKAIWYLEREIGNE